MEVTVLTFGVAKEITQQNAIVVSLEKEAATVAHLQLALEQAYPRLQQIGTYLIAVNQTYANAETLLKEKDEIAIIPPVSGG